MTEDRRARERGFTLAEVMAVMVIAAVITFGMVGFYLNSQGTWIDASSQAMAQRDATLILETVAERCRPWARAEVQAVSGANDLLIVRDESNVEKVRVYWDPADSLVHQSVNGAASGPEIVDTRVERFSASIDPSGKLVFIDTLRVLSANRHTVQLSTAFALKNYAP